MKKYFIFLLALTLVIIFISCNSKIKDKSLQLLCWTGYEEEDFLGWCRETFGGQFIPYLVVNGNSGPWLSMEDFYSNSLRRNESWQEEIKNIIFYECCEGDELELSAHGLPTLEYIDNYMKFKYVNIQHCEEKVLWGSKKNPIVKIEWMWVEEKDLMREWSGF